MVLASPPIIIKHPENETVRVFSSVTFECIVEGYGYINVEWRKLGTALPNTAAVSNTNFTNGVSSVLTITNIISYYSGMYFCAASNLAGGNISKYAKLSVEGTQI